MATKESTVEAPEKDVVTDPTAFDDFVEHEKKALQEFGKAFAALLPEGLREHGDSAVKEMVEGYRGLFNATLDDIIKRIEKVKLDDRQSRKKSRVPIK